MSGLVALRQHNHQALRRRPKGRAAPLAITAIVLTTLPARIGYQDVAAMIASQPAVGESFRAHLIASPFGTIHAATFSFPQPVGTGIPAGADLHVAAYAAGSDVTGALAHALPTAPSIDLQTTSSRRNFPEINRALKGPRLVPRVRPDFDSPQPSTTDGPNPAPGLQPVGRPTPTAGAADEATTDSTETTSATPAPDNADFAYFDPSGSDAVEGSLIDGDGATVQAARLYFGAASLGGTLATMEPWGPGQAPVFEPREPETAVAAPNAAAPFEVPRNETVAPKGEVTGEEHRPMSPAEHLGLVGATRAKQEKCLADAIVYQNAHRHLACQFTFACDGIPERINEPAAWERAKHIAREALDGKFWLNDIGKATHYHARWVHPWWVREMRKLDRIGVHTFYRPRNWGDGSKSPTWGDAEATATAAKTL